MQPRKGVYKSGGPREPGSTLKLKKDKSNN